MWTALRRLSLRHFRAHKLRTLFTIAGIALGVATITGMRLVHESVAKGYERTVERIAGKAVFQISNGEVGVPEELLEEVRAVSGVSAAAASVQGFVSVAGMRGERLYVFGVDLVADDELRDYQSSAAEAELEDPLVFLAQPDSVALTGAFADRNGLELEDRIEVLAPGGRSALTIRGLLDMRTGPATLFGGRLAVMDVFAAQRLFGLDRRFSQIDVGLAEGADPAVVSAALSRVVGSRGVVERPQSRGAMLENLLAANRYGMTVAAMLAVVVGLYLIFNTLMMTVVQRRSEIGVLRSLGMQRGQVLRMIVSEALLLGIVGSLVGIPLGIALARGMSAAFAWNVSTMYVPVETPEVTARVGPILWGVLLGLVSALLAAGLPAREAVRIHPLEVLRSSSPRSGGARAFSAAALAGLALVVLSAAAWILNAYLPLRRNLTGGFAMVGFLVGLSLVVPIVVREAARRGEALIGRLLGPLGGLASRNIVSHIGRVAVTCSAFLVSLTGAIAIATWLSSFQKTLGLWLDGLFANIDIVITSGAEPLAQDSVPLPGALAEEIATLPGIERVDVVRMVRLAYEGSLTLAIATDARLYQQGHRRLTVLDGDAKTTIDALVSGEGVAVNEAFSRRFRVKAGDFVTIPAPSGAARLRVASTYFDPTFADMGTILLDRAVYRRLWRDDLVNFIEPVLERGADRTSVIDAIRERWGERHDLFVVTIEEFRREAEGILDQTIALAYPLIAVSIVIALLGVVNALLASVLDRIREIGILRAIGATRGQVVRSVVLESSLIGGLGGLLAAVFGSLFGWMQLEILFRGMLGVTVFYRYPGEAVAFALIAAVLLAAMAGYLPGRRAARLEVARALEYE